VAPVSHVSELAIMKRGSVVVSLLLAAACGVGQARSHSAARHLLARAAMQPVLLQSRQLPPTADVVFAGCG